MVVFVGVIAVVVLAAAGFQFIARGGTSTSTQTTPVAVNTTPAP
jgi:hypothetical protein